jgi:hypothetical protein
MRCATKSNSVQRIEFHRRNKNTQEGAVAASSETWRLRAGLKKKLSDFSQL